MSESEPLVRCGRGVRRRLPDRELLGWSTIALVLATLAVPWFLWGADGVVAGLPVWIWWHVGWMGLASVTFYVFTQRAWGVGVTEGSRDG